MIPRLSTMLENFFKPGIFLTVLSSDPFRYSIGVTSASSPETSANEARTLRPSPRIP